MNSRSNNIWLIYLGLAVCTILVYWQVARFDFINFDDYGYVRDNPHVKYGFSIDNIKWAFQFNGYASNWHPLTWLSHMLDGQLFGIDAGKHHLVSLGLHIANTLLLFFLLKKITGMIWKSAFVSALFALHPIHVESVAWIAERKDVLSTFFMFLAIIVYSYYVEHKKNRWYLVLILVFMFGLMAKPMIITLPFVLLLLDYWPFGRLDKKAILEKIPLLIISAISSFITYFIQQKGGAVISDSTLSIKYRIANTFISYIRYLGMTFYPKGLAIFYPHLREQIHLAAAIGAFLVIAAITILVIYYAQKYKYLPVGWFWFLGMLVPVIGLVQVGGGALADRYTYVSVIGIFIIAAWGCNDLVSAWKYKKTILGLCSAGAIIILSVFAHLQAGYWKDGKALFKHAIDVTNDNYVAYHCFGDAMQEEGDISAAIKYFDKSLSIEKNYLPAIVSMASALNLTGRSQEAVNYLTRAIELQPDIKRARTYGELAQTMVNIGKMREAIILYEKAYQIEPDLVTVINNLAWHYATSSDDKIRNPAKAILLAEKACKLTNFETPQVLDTHAAALAAKGDFDHAVEIAEKGAALCTDKELNIKLEILKRIELYKNGKCYIEQ